MRLRAIDEIFLFIFTSLTTNLDNKFGTLDEWQMCLLQVKYNTLFWKSKAIKSLFYAILSQKMNSCSARAQSAGATWAGPRYLGRGGTFTACGEDQPDRQALLGQGRATLAGATAPRPVPRRLFYWG
jgi:hypothetical protein